MSDTHRPIPTGEEPGLNMTPMIDVVFQLLVFFLLSLKFKSVDRRIESFLPNDRGPVPSEVFLEETPHLVVKLFREDPGDPDAAFTRIRVGNHTTLDLPSADESPARSATLALLTEHLSSARASIGFDPAVKGEIRTPPPKGISVPHGDVMAVLDAFLDADVADVTFQGARSPLPAGR